MTIDRLSLFFPTMEDKCSWLIFDFFKHSKLTPFTLPDPVPLHLLDPFWPVEIINITEKSLGILRDSEYPLSYSTLLDSRSTSITRII